MKRKLILNYVVDTVLILLVFLAAAGVLAFQAYENQLTKDLRNIVSWIRIDKSNGISNEAISYKYSHIGYISVINKEGELIASLDSALDSTENLLSREEFQEALKEGEGSSLRKSEVKDRYFFYRTYTMGDEILLIAVPVITATEVLADYGGTMAWLSLGVLLLSFGIAIYFYRNNIRPVLVLEGYLRGDGSREGTEVDVQSLPKELKDIAETYQQTRESLVAEAAAGEEKRLYLLSTINTIKDGILAVDEADNITLMNKSAMSVLDLSEEEDLHLDILVATQNLELKEALKERAENAQPREIRLKERTYILSVHPIPQKGGSLLILHDVTKVRELENMRKEFVSNVSHELKTPLTSIRGFIETLKGGAAKDPAVADKFLEIINIESLRLESLIGDLLALSKIEENRSVAVEDVDLSPLAREVLEKHRKAAEMAGVQLTEELEESLAYRGNPELFKSLLSNLLSNAIKYNHKGGEVLLRGERKKKNLVLEVRDTGIGIPEEEQPRVFERFYKVDKSRALDHDSSGLGLAIVKHIVELYDGEIKLESTPGEGTSFRIKLPLKEEA